MSIAGYIDGHPACSCLMAWIPAFEKKIGRNIAWRQLIGDAPASAHFHEGGGAADCGLLSDDDRRVARNMGGAAWNRYWRNIDGSTNYHCHIRLNGCPHNTIAQPQVEDLNEGRDGTGPLYDNVGPADPGPRDGVQWPLRTWQQGIEWAQGEDIDMTPEQDALLKAVAQGISQLKEETGVEVGSGGVVRGTRLHQQVEALGAKVDAISVGGVDVDSLAAKIADNLIAKLKA